MRGNFYSDPGWIPAVMFHKARCASWYGASSCALFSVPGWIYSAAHVVSFTHISNSLVELVASGKPGGSELRVPLPSRDRLPLAARSGEVGPSSSRGLEVEEAAGMLPPLAWAVKYLSNFAILALLSSCSFLSFLFCAPLLCLGLLKMMILFYSFHTQQQHNNAL